MKSKKYLLKVTSAENENIFRIIKIDGSNTLDTLSRTILNAFEFDQLHHYMFTIPRKYGDPDKYCHPMSETGEHADKVKLDSLDLKARNRFFYLYDFIDEWNFHITVKKIREEEISSVAKVIEASGSLEQYYDYGDDSDEILEGDIVIDILFKKDEVIQKQLRELPAHLQILWRDLVEHELSTVDEIALRGIFSLSEAGLLVTRELENYVILEMHRSKTDLNTYKFLNDVLDRYRVEKAMYYLVKYYGIIESDELCRILSECSLPVKYDSMDLPLMIERMDKWKLWNCYTAQDGTQYITLYKEEIIQLILKARRKYPVKVYRFLTKTEKELLCSGDWDLLVPVYEDCYHYLVYERYWDPDDVELLLAQVEKYVAIGSTESEYLEWAKEAVAESCDKMTKWTESVLKKLRKSMPSAALKGYTWNEYDDMKRALPDSS